MSESEKGCPHADVRFCPLYHAAHEGWGLGCDDGKLDAMACAASRKLNYAKAVSRLRVEHPGYVERIEWNQALEESRQQRERNIRLNGIH